VASKGDALQVLNRKCAVELDTAIHDRMTMYRLRFSSCWFKKIAWSMRSSARPQQLQLLCSKRFVAGTTPNMLPSMQRLDSTQPQPKFKHCRRRCARHGTALTVLLMHRFTLRSAVCRWRKKARCSGGCDCSHTRKVQRASAISLQTMQGSAVVAHVLSQTKTHASFGSVMQAVALAVKTCVCLRPAPQPLFSHEAYFLLCRSAADCTRAVSGALGLMDGYNQRLLFANRSCNLFALSSALSVWSFFFPHPSLLKSLQAHGDGQVHVQSARCSAPSQSRCFFCLPPPPSVCRCPPHCCRYSGEEPAAASRSRDIELAGLQSRLAASTSELQRLNAERDSLVATMAVVDDVHARALQQVRGEAEAASQVRREGMGVGRDKRRWKLKRV
jgi:hypothetical protein